jgi:pimeloyl-ACP methyl ester carboxylesterase
VLVFDHRRFGSSDYPRRLVDQTRVDLDAIAAVRELRRRGAASVVLAGASLGGSAAIAAAAVVRPPVQGVISLAAPRLFGRVNTLAAARRLSVPALFLAAVEDEPFAGDARVLHDAAPSPDKRLVILPGSDHGVPLLRDPGTRALFDGWIAAHSGS